MTQISIVDEQIKLNLFLKVQSESTEGYSANSKNISILIDFSEIISNVITASRL